MAFRLTEGPGAGPHPSEVPGFECARALGLLPVPPEQPPAPVVANSQRATLWLFVAVALAFLAMPLSESLGVSFVWPMIPAAGLILAGIIVPSRLRAAEFAAGYTRVDAHVGIAVVDWKLRFQNGGGPAGAEWDLCQRRSKTDPFPTVES